MRTARLLLLPLASCNPAEPPLLIDAGERPPQIAAPADGIKDAIRADAQRRFGDACGEVVLPDRAFVPVAITGGGEREHAVLFSEGRCTGSLTQWQTTAGTLVQFWGDSAGRPRLLLEQHTYGFTPTATGLQSLQRIHECGGTGAAFCMISYRWNAQAATLEVSERQPMDGIRGPRMQFDFRAARRDGPAS